MHCGLGKGIKVAEALSYLTFTLTTFNDIIFTNWVSYCCLAAVC